MQRHIVKRRHPGALRWLGTMVICLMFWGLTPHAEAESLSDFSAEIDNASDFQFASAMVVDQNTGQVIYTHQPDERQSIASLTKVLALDLIYNHLEAGTLTLDTKVPVSEEVAALSTVPGLSNAPLEASTDFYTVDELIDVAMVASGNAAVRALAEKVSGSETAFVKELTQHLHEMGISDFSLTTATGLSGEYVAQSDEDPAWNQVNQMTVREYLQVVRKILARHPEIMTRSLPTEVSVTGPSGKTTTVPNQNQLIPGMPFGRVGVTGGKTGTQSEDDRAVFVQAQLKGRPVLAIVLGDGNDPLRYQDTSRLLDTLDTTLEWHAIHEAGEQVGEKDNTVYVPQGVKQYTSLYYEDSVGYFDPVSDNADEDVQTSYKNSINYDNDGNLIAKAPFAAGEAVNEMYYTPQSPYFEVLDGQGDISVRVIASESIDKAPFLVRVTRTLNDMIETFLQPAPSNGDTA